MKNKTKVPLICITFFLLTAAFMFTAGWSKDQFCETDEQTDNCDRRSDGVNNLFLWGKNMSYALVVISTIFDIALMIIFLNILFNPRVTDWANNTKLTVLNLRAFEGSDIY